MWITSQEQFEKLRACGIIVAKALRAMSAAVRPGITTREVSEIGARILSASGARSSPPMVYNFPGDVCISVNDEVVHGIPSGRRHPARRSREARPHRRKRRLPHRLCRQYRSPANYPKPLTPWPTVPNAPSVKP